MEQVKTLHNILRKLTQPTKNVELLRKQSQLTPEQGDNADEIFLNGVAYARAELALNLRNELKKLQLEEDFKEHVESGSSHIHDTLAEAQKKLILGALQKNGGNKMQAARMLDISTKTLYNKLNEYSIKV